MSRPYLDEEKECLNKLHERGHWRFVFRPHTFKQRVSDHNELFALVDKCRVDLGGWRFPYVPDYPGELNNGRRHVDKDWVGQIHRWEHHLEAWRFYSSGQFSSVSSVPWDWRDESGWWPAQMTPGWKPNDLIGIAHITQAVLQAIEFCARLAVTPAGDEQLHIELALGQTEGRGLFSDSPRRFLWPGYKATVDTVPERYDFSRPELLATIDKTTANAVGRIFAAFGFNAAPQVLEGLIAEVRGQ